VPDWQPYLSLQRALQEVESRLAGQPGSGALHLERARLLTAMGKLHEAKQIYIDLLKQDPQQLEPLTSLAVILSELGYRQAALKVAWEAVTRFPGSVSAHVNLARALHKTGELEEARIHYETILRLASDHAGAHQGLASLLMEMNEDEGALAHARLGYGDTPWVTSVYRGREEPVQVLVLVSARGGNSPIKLFLDNGTFLTTEMIVDFYAGPVPLPAHQLVVNAVGDADLGRGSLMAAQRVLEQTSAPVINRPAKVFATGRDENAARLGRLEGVVTPRIATISRERLLRGDPAGFLRGEGFVFPLLLRTPGFHGGAHFVKVETEQGLAPALTTLPGEALAVIQYLDARDRDGKFRKYRVMMIGGALYPLHKAVSLDWKVHYFSAGMGSSPEHRAEDATFLEDMPGVLGPDAMAALARIQESLGLDYAGADFSLGPRGEVLLFEANATMMAPLPGEGFEWDYRRAPVGRVHAALREMLLRRGGARPIELQT
jgi:hypothetical protein